MRVAVVGAGPAGLTAAYRLGAHHDVTVFEAGDAAGGRTHTEHFGPGHWNDTGAGWLASFYPDTLSLLTELREVGGLTAMRVRGGGDLLLDGKLHAAPNSIRRLVATDLLGPIQKVRFLGFMATLLATQRGDLRIDMRYDDQPAMAALAPAGSAAVAEIIRPMFEGPFFARLQDMSAALVRSWLRVLSTGTFYHVDGGMDAPWRRLGERLDVRFATPVSAVDRLPNGSVLINLTRGAPEAFDAVVIAVPAPLAAQLAPWHPAAAVLGRIRYAPHIRLYAARQRQGVPRSGIHVFPNDVVATVEIGSGRGGAWGNVPDDWEWELICAPAATSGGLLELSDEAATAELLATARRIDPRVFDPVDAEVFRLIRWPMAVPIVDPGYYGRLVGFPDGPPIVFCGDGRVQPCVEGAVRSGLRAAAALSSVGI